jgi:hypothetical protein
MVSIASRSTYVVQILRIFRRSQNGIDFENTPGVSLVVSFKRGWSFQSQKGSRHGYGLGEFTICGSINK